MSLVKQPDMTSAPALPDALACDIPFKLDPFQAHAVCAIHAEENVLVTAKTGSGKTFVGEYQIAHSLARGGRVFYTTPIKSLSNQKFHDFKRMYPSVGIMTGDIKYRPDAAVVILTTEILRNLLYKQSTATESLGITAGLTLDGLDAVVFDECHYINDRDRGHVWEETMILLPQHVKLVLLSATIDSPEVFARWIAAVRQRHVWLLSTAYRIVPLVHGMLRLDGEMIIVQDAKETFYAHEYKAWLNGRVAAEKEADRHRAAVGARRAGGYEDPVVARGARTARFPHILNTTIRTLEQKEFLPALFFVLSRKDCESYANTVEGTLLDSSDTASVNHIIDFHLHRHFDTLQSLEQYHALRRLLVRGIAYHHSGLLPLLKEIIEILFAKGFVKVLFATETFAVGINMPTKTVVFTGYRKYDDATGGMRMLRTDEYIQMAGRAGRRGKDVRGIVLYLPVREPESLEDVRMMMSGKRSAITSRMTFSYEFLLKVVHNPALSWRSILENSYWRQQLTVYRSGLETELAAARTALAAFGLSEAELSAMRERDSLQAAVRGKTNAEQKAAQRALGQWENAHVGPRWVAVRKAWPETVRVEKEVSGLERELAEADAYDEEIHAKLDVLRQLGFLEGDSLTALGTQATEVNEGHTILMPLLFQRRICHELSANELMALLAAFASDSEKEDVRIEHLDVPKPVVGALRALESMVAWYIGAQPFDDPALSLAAVEPVYKWLEGAGLAEAASGMYEGNFLRILRKMESLLEEWRTLATLAGDVGMLEKMVGVETVLLRGIATSESLYLRI